MLEQSTILPVQAKKHKQVCLCEVFRTHDSAGDLNILKMLRRETRKWDLSKLKLVACLNGAWPQWGELSEGTRCKTTRVHENRGHSMEFRMRIFLNPKINVLGFDSIAVKIGYFGRSFTSHGDADLSVYSSFVKLLEINFHAYFTKHLEDLVKREAVFGDLGSGTPNTGVHKPQVSTGIPVFLLCWANTSEIALSSVGPVVSLCTCERNRV